MEWRSPCGLFESVRAAPSACENRSAIFAPEREGIGGLSQVALERALTTRVRVIASVCGSRSWLVVLFYGFLFDGSLAESPCLLSLSRGQLACSFIFVINSSLIRTVTFVTSS